MGHRPQLRMRQARANQLGLVAVTNLNLKVERRRDTSGIYFILFYASVTIIVLILFFQKCTEKWKSHDSK